MNESAIKSIQNASEDELLAQLTDYNVKVIISKLICSANCFYVFMISPFLLVLFVSNPVVFERLNFAATYEAL